jgi:hypothetical protein
VSRVWPSFAFFFLFLVYLLGNPLIFDVPRTQSVTGVLETTLKRCLSARIGGVNTYKVLRALNSSVPVSGIAPWSCPLRLDNVVLQSVGTVGSRGQNVTYNLVNAGDISKWPDITSDTYYTTHALRFSTEVSYRGTGRGKALRYWVSTEARGSWPWEYRYWTDVTKGQSAIFQMRGIAHKYRHRVLPADFGDHARPWATSVLVASAACGFAVVADAVNVFQLGARAFFPERFPGSPVLLVAPSVGGVAFRSALLLVEILVVAYNIQWISSFTNLVNERTGANAYADWNTAERYVRAASALKLCVVLAAVPGLAFARVVPKPSQFHLTNAIAAATLLIFLVGVVETAPVFRIEEAMAALSPDVLFSTSTVGVGGILVTFGAALFARRKNPISKKGRQWQYFLLSLRRREQRRRMQRVVASFDRMAEPRIATAVRTPSGAVAVQMMSPQDLSAEAARSGGGGAIAAASPAALSAVVDADAARFGAAAKGDSRLMDSVSKFAPPYAFWFIMQRITIAVACLCQLALYGTCLFVFLNPLLIDVPYGAIDRPSGIKSLVDTAIKAKPEEYGSF